ncbi:MAG: HupE/UreJ family protein, partial [Gammaproteobacteria bacterium]|nr:HupE/UreJ family protein [Gammaproteobacteria bacterium]
MIHRAARLLLLAVSAGAVHAHDMQMAIVEVREVDERSYALTMRSALDTERLPGIDLSLTDGCEDVGPIRRVERFDHVSFERRIACPVDGPPPALGVWNAGIVDALIRIEDRAGNLTTRIVSEPFAEIVLGEPGAGIAERLLLGVEHILSGIDHLLFVFGILLLVRGVRVVVATITAFTLAHSLTLALTVLDVVRVPGPPVEAFIALSIVYLAAEVGRGGRAADARLTPPWVVALAL